MSRLDIPIDHGRITLTVTDASNELKEISVNAYTGLIGKIMQLIGYAIFVGINQEGVEVFINKRSLAKQVLLCKDPNEREMTKKIKDKVLPSLLKKLETMKAEAELQVHYNRPDAPLYQTKLQRAQLDELLLESDLELIWQHRAKLRAPGALYNYINGIIDIDGKVRELEIKRSHLEYIERLRALVGPENPIRVTLQLALEQSLDSSKEGQASQITPLDHYLKNPENKKRFEELPEKHKKYIKEAAKDNYVGISNEDQKKLGEEEHQLRNDPKITEMQRVEFKRCMKLANQQNAARSGFIHFRAPEAMKMEPFERIYIQMNKERAEELVAILMRELYNGEYPKVIDIKVAGPQVAGRTDGIVIYIGEVKDVGDEALQRLNAAQEREKVVKKLVEIQKERPELFDNSPMPFKVNIAPGIATIPGLSTTESFTTDLCRAIESALASTKAPKDFRHNVIQAFFASRAKRQ